MEFPLNTTCHRRSCCGSTRAGRLAGSSPCLRCGSRTMTGRAPAPPPWPPLPPPEGGATRLGPGHLWRENGLMRLYLCSSLTPPRTLWEKPDKHTTFIQLPLLAQQMFLMIFTKTKNGWSHLYLSTHTLKSFIPYYKNTLTTLVYELSSRGGFKKEFTFQVVLLKSISTWISYSCFSFCLNIRNTSQINSFL